MARSIECLIIQNILLLVADNVEHNLVFKKYKIKFNLLNIYYIVHILVISTALSFNVKIIIKNFVLLTINLLKDN